MYKLKRFVASASRESPPTHASDWLWYLTDSVTSGVDRQIVCCRNLVASRVVRSKKANRVCFHVFFFFFTKSRHKTHLHGNNTQSDKPPWALGPSAHSPPRWWGLLWAEGPEGSGWGAAVSERDCGKSPVPKTLEQRKWPFKILQAIIKGHCLCRKVS